ncbi:MAG: hypothetical protein KDK33_09875, partial [Leptospiraceae bacterium]|nr:hypothetical protein [Leptospiraceae bacterium]
MIRILLIEDDAAQRSALEEYLGSLSEEFQVIAVGNIADAKSILESEKFSLIISDLFLPDD